MKYSTDPPTTGKHFQIPAQDGIYGEAPRTRSSSTRMEHGRVIFWVKPSLPE